MTSQGDPYRTLGIAPGASENEIRSAYRRLAKKYHPDAAGDRALPRFLAIQAAYESLVDGEGRLRPPGVPRPRPAGGGGSRPGGAGRGSGPGGADSGASGPRPYGPGGAGARPDGEAWQADPSRARASRDAWRARRSTGSAPGSGRPGTAGAAGDGSGPRPGGSPGPASAGRPGEGPRERTQHHARRGTRKATQGSTSYDDAADEPLDPEWGGGAWYGPSSGTYWTLNPREYADPRKHGPEYLARARRATGAGGAGDVGDTGDTGGAPGAAATGNGPAAPSAGAPPDTASGAAEDAWRWTGHGPTTTDGGEAEWRAHAWTYDAADAGRPTWTTGAQARGRPGLPPRDDLPELPDLEAQLRRLAPERLLALALRPDRRWRLLLALVGWPPIGLSLDALLSSATGCATFSAACPPAVPVIGWLLQPLVVAGLFLVPLLAAVTSFAAIAALAVALPLAAVLAVGSLPESRSGSVVLLTATAVAWLVGIGFAAVRLPGHREAPPSGP